MAGLEPFNPKKHKPIDLPGGRKATEYLASETSPEGKAWNIPQIWFNTKTGAPVFLKGDKAWSESKRYEEKTGFKFPRFETISKAVQKAELDSASGGASKKSLISRGSDK
tara:strand:- start:392 stop:721 length:330 start_codon:yes stop_codon:yes gene_type:complete